jgi:hypothetical protein
MKTVLFRSALSCTLMAVALSASAQQMKIESQGEAAVEAQKEALVAMSMSKAIGLPVAGKGQVVFFRSSRSPGAPLDIHADGKEVGELPAGMYFAVPATPGTHAYASGSAGPLSVAVSKDKTYFVQVIRDRAGRPQLLRSTAVKFQRATH